MSLGEAQYYEGKVFLKALVEAHQTLDEAAKEKAQVDKLKYFESNLVSASKAGQIKINGDTLVKGRNFESTRISHASEFVKKYFRNVLKNFESANNSTEVRASLENALR